MAKTEDRALTPQAKAQSIRSLFNDNRVKGEIMKALPKHLTADKLIRVAMTSIQRNPKLMDCTQQSLLGCIMTSAALGLEPDLFSARRISSLTGIQRKTATRLSSCPVIAGI